MIGVRYHPPTNFTHRVIAVYGWKRVWQFFSPHNQTKTVIWMHAWKGLKWIICWCHFSNPGIQNPGNYQRPKTFTIKTGKNMGSRYFTSKMPVIDSLSPLSYLYPLKTKILLMLYNFSGRLTKKWIQQFFSRIPLGVFMKSTLAAVCKEWACQGQFIILCVTFIKKKKIQRIPILPFDRNICQQNLTAPLRDRRLSWSTSKGDNTFGSVCLSVHLHNEFLGLCPTVHLKEWKNWKFRHDKS